MHFEPCPLLALAQGWRRALQQAGFPLVRRAALARPAVQHSAVGLWLAAVTVSRPSEEVKFHQPLRRLKGPPHRRYAPCLLATVAFMVWIRLLSTLLFMIPVTQVHFFPDTSPWLLDHPQFFCRLE